MPTKHLNLALVKFIFMLRRLILVKKKVTIYVLGTFSFCILRLV